MTTEIMNSVLAKTKHKMEAAKRKIMFFMDNHPCHTETLSDLNAKVAL